MLVTEDWRLNEVVSVFKIDSSVREVHCILRTEKGANTKLLNLLEISLPRRQLVLL
jgi:hypothetical protein